ncbi:MAG: LysR family transcriptional regulator [Proteobacteria bacterium]|nr:LysR family transcriptional regulator [Pseudomonadota bacterium]
MDTNKLRYFCVVAEYGSIRKAAEILRISPAALSKAVGLLEADLGEELLLPDGRGIVISSFGNDLAKKSRPILAQLEELSSPSKVRSKSLEITRFGTFEVFSTYFFGKALKPYAANFQFELRELIPGELEQALKENIVDLGLTYLPIPTAGIEHLKVGQVHMRIFGQKNSFEKSPFENLPFAVPISPVSGSPTKVQGLDGWPDDQVARFIKFRVTLMESALELCRQGLAVGYFPSFVVELHNAQLKAEFQLEALSSPPALKEQIHPVYIVKRKNDSETKTMRMLAKAVRATLSLRS